VYNTGKSLSDYTAFVALYCDQGIAKYKVHFDATAHWSAESRAGVVRNAVQNVGAGVVATEHGE
jgi:hypothetical protein